MSHHSTSIRCLGAATDIIGDKWTPHLLRYIANETKVRFCQLQSLAGGINPRTLTARLAALERDEIIIRTKTVDSSRYEYRLSQKGRDLLPILEQMAAWSQRYEVSQ